MMNKLKLVIGLFLFLLCSSMMGQTALPLTVTEGVFNDASVFYSKDRVEWSDGGIKTTNLQDGGYAYFKFDEAPGKLTLEYKRTSYGKNRVMWICESNDGEEWTDLYRNDPSTSWQTLSVALSKTTRYIQVGYDAKYKFGDVGSRMGYWRNVIVSGVVSLPVLSGASTGALGTKIAHTFTVNYSNPAGDLVLSSGDPHIVFDKDGATTKTISGVVGQEGSAEVIVYYDSSVDATMGYYEVPVVIADAGNEGYSKTYTINLTVDGPIALPESAGTAVGMVGHAILHTFKVNDAMPLEDLSVTSSNENVQIVSIVNDEDNAEQKLVTVSYVPQSAEEGQAADITLTDRTSSFQKVYHLDYTVNEAFTLTASSMMAETGVVGKALPFSFIVNRMKGVALTFGSENPNIVFEQTEFLPAEADGEQVVQATYRAALPGTDAADIIIKDAAGVDTYSKTLQVDFLSRPAVPVSTVDIKRNSITVSWQPMEGITTYLFSMYDADGTTYGDYADYVVEGTSIEVVGLTPETTYSYTLKAKYSDELISDASASTTVVPTATCTINVGTYNDFEVSLGSKQIQSIIITVPNAEGDVNATLSGSENFRLLNNTVASGGNIDVEYTPVIGGIEEAELVLSSLNANDVVVPLKGYGYSFPATILTEKKSFTIVWSNMGEVKSELTFDGNAAEDVTGLTIKTFDDLAIGSTHTYRMTYTFADEKVMEGEIVSVTTTTDYGHQLNNTGFEHWEGTGDDAEPVDWNSFMTNTGSYASMARAKQIEVSEDVRPGTNGTSSAYIWTRNVIASIKANGNLTTGRINAGAMSATNESNHNFTVTDDPAFSEAMNGARPDSLTVWVKYVPGSSSDKARVSAIIHDKYDLKDPSSDATNNSHIMAKAVLNYSATDDKGWQRLSIPFDYCGPATSADYMLVTYTSNMTAGGGSTNDAVYVDDMLLIYNPSVTITAVNKTAYKQGEQIEVSYDLEGTMSPTNLNADANVVTLQLSDATGSFDNALNLTSVTTDYSGTLKAVLPEDLPVGNGYRVRIVTTNYPMVSNPNSSDIRIFEPGVPMVSTSTPTDFIALVNETAVQTILVEGSNLESNILLSLDTVEEGFSLDKSELPAAGGEITITYAATVGRHRATLTLIATGVEPIVITLNGITRPLAPVVNSADEITSESFMAHWEAVEGEAVSYRITVKNGGETMDGYPQITNDTSYPVDGLDANTMYTYFVETIIGDLCSDASEEVTVTTINPTIINAVSASLIVYPVPTRDILYIKGCEAKEVSIYSVDGIYVAKKSVIENRIDVSNLAAGTYLVNVVTESGQVYRTRIIKE